jgi:hypothetical protein
MFLAPCSHPSRTQTSRAKSSAYRAVLDSSRTTSRFAPFQRVSASIQNSVSEFYLYSVHDKVSRARGRAALAASFQSIEFSFSLAFGWRKRDNETQPKFHYRSRAGPVCRWPFAFWGSIVSFPAGGSNRKITFSKIDTFSIRLNA